MIIGLARRPSCENEILLAESILADFVCRPTDSICGPSGTMLGGEPKCCKILSKLMSGFGLGCECVSSESGDVASDGRGDFIKRGEGETADLAGVGRGSPPERRLPVLKKYESSTACRSWSPFAYIKLEAGDILPWAVDCTGPCPGPGLGRDVSKSEEAVDRASEAWKNIGEAAAMSEKELGRETCDPSAVKVLARKLLDCSGFTPRAGLRSVLRAPWSPRPTVG